MSDFGAAQPGVLRVLQSKSEIQAFYDKISGIYDLMAEHSEAPVRMAGIELLGVHAGERVLEIGFGTGHCLVELAAKVGPEGRVYGVDFSAGMVAQAAELLGKENLIDQVEMTCGDAESLPYADSIMDAVFMSFTLELFDTPEIPLVLSECKRVLKPGGRIVLVAMSKEGGNGLMVGAFEWTHRHFPNYLDCRPIFAGQAVESAGFRIGERRKMNMWVPVDLILGWK
jgi:ubiquinone/menaquinone biosynthesis C-methylase UbiE